MKSCQKEECQQGQEKEVIVGERTNPQPYVKALDGGDPALEANYRDEVFEVEAPLVEKEKFGKKSQTDLAELTGEQKTQQSFMIIGGTQETEKHMFLTSNSTSNQKFFMTETTKTYTVIREFFKNQKHI